jgi:hypothetical protein
MQPDALLADNDRSNIGARSEFQDIINRIAEDDLYALAL